MKPVIVTSIVDGKGYRNTGDMSCNLLDYFSFTINVIHVPWQNIKSFVGYGGIIIIGGGGLISESTLEFIKELTKCNKVIFWGTGLNMESFEILEGEINLTLGLALHIGLRDQAFCDYNGYDWVACPSCLSKDIMIARDSPSIPGEVFVYSHYQEEIEIPLDCIDSWEYTNNGSGLTMNEVLKKMARADFIVTNSYHGAYWGMLLNRKVIGVNCFAPRFFSGLPTFPIVRNTHEATYLMRFGDLRANPDYVTECRQSNMNFYKKVMRHLEHLKNKF